MKKFVIGAVLSLAVLLSSASWALAGEPNFDPFADSERELVVHESFSDRHESVAFDRVRKCNCKDGCKCPGRGFGGCKCGKQREESACSKECTCGCNDGKSCRCGEVLPETFYAAPRPMSTPVPSAPVLPTAYARPAVWYPAQPVRTYQPAYQPAYRPVSWSSFPSPALFRSMPAIITSSSRGASRSC